MTAELEKNLCMLYGAQGRDLLPPLMEILENFEKPAGKKRPLTHRDALLISYGDMLSPPEGAAPGESGLARLDRFLSRWNRGSFSYLHLLPFHPYSSDDGFSVIDYRAVDGRFGSWEDIKKLKDSVNLVFDFVLNHGSVQSRWFKSFLAQEEKYRDWYLTRDAGYDYSTVTRPRTHPLLTPFTLRDGSVRHVWTTFSADQADYDFSRPQVLLEFIKIFLEYIRRGASVIRLDAIAYLWKEDGSPCIHHPKTHGVVKLFRAIIDGLDLDMRILTETNVPHRENISYFGGGDEAHMVYNFALPPLVLYAALSADTEPLKNWAKTLPPGQPDRLFLNFLASHDGVGLTPAKGLVDDRAFAAALEKARERGALISYKASPQGPVPYELNCSYASIAAPPALGNADRRARAFLAAQAVLLALPGLPAVYFHSWTGSENWTEGPGLLGYNRAINREKPPIDAVERALDTPGTFRNLVYQGFQKLLAFRRGEEAFGPETGMEILDGPPAVFALLRGPDRNGRGVLCAMNFSNEEKILNAASPQWHGPRSLTLLPWQSLWLAAGGPEPGAGIAT